MKKKNKIILSYPFSGSIYAFFHEEYNGIGSAKKMMGHPYYKTLYGFSYNKYLDLTLTLSILYDEIYLIPADNILPEYEKYDTSNYYNPNLGLYTSWDDFVKLRDEIDDKIKKDLRDPVINKILKKLSASNKEHILRDTRYEIHLANQQECSIFSLKGRKALIERLLYIDKVQYSKLTDSEIKIKVVEEYLNIAGLIFNPKNLENLYYLKADKDLRNYSSSFISILDEFNERDEIRKKLLMLTKESIDSSNLSTKCSGFFDTTSNIMSLGGFVPVVGPFISAGSVLSMGGSKLLNRHSNKKKWYEFGPQVKRLSTIYEISKKIDEELKGNS